MDYSSASFDLAGLGRVHIYFIQGHVNF